MSFSVSIVGGKDGVGKTTFALHLAYGLLKSGNYKVCLIEADAGNLGDLPTLLNAKGSKRFTDFCQQLGRLDPKLTLNWIGRHPSGLAFLSGAGFVTDFQNLDDKTVDKAFKLLSRAYDYLVIDLGRDINPLSFRALENTDLNFVVTDSDILSANQTGEYVKKLRALHFGNEQMQVVINKFEPKGVVNPNVLKQKLGLNIGVTLPKDSAALQQTVSTAKPLHLISPRHPYLKGIDEAIRIVHTQAKSPKSKKSSRSGQPLSVLKQVLPFTYGSSEGSTDIPPKGKTPNPIMERNISIRQRIHRRLLELVDLKEIDALQLESDPEKKEELRAKTVQAVHQLMEQEGKEVQDRNERAALAKDVIDEALGYGALEPLLEASDVTEIMVNGRDQIYVEQNGKITLTDYVFTSEKHLLGCIERIVSPIGRRVDEKTPLCDARLPDGSRINVVIPPLALRGPTLTIRKFFKDKLTIEDLIKFGSLTDEMSDFLRAAVQSHLNIIVSGGTGTGKTTLLNMVAGFIPGDERIVTVEDAAELQLPQEHVITLESRPPNLQGEGAISIRDLVRNSLRMRPDRIVVGECRAGEALDMLQAMNTGHDGSLTTVHANNPRDCLRRIETLVMMAGFDLPITAIREQISSAVNLIVQLKRFSDGSRKISHVTEVIGIEGETLVTQPIYEFKQTGTNEKGKVTGQYQKSGLIPKFVEELKAKGIALPRGLFGSGTSASSGEKPKPPSGGPSGSGSGTSASSSRRPKRSGTKPGKIPIRNPHGIKKR